MHRLTSLLRPFALALATSAVIALAHAEARADAIAFTGGFGASATVSNFTLSGNTFTFTVTNTSTSGSITAIGFDLPGSRTGFTLVSPTGTGFTLAQGVAAQAGAVTTQGINQGAFDFALLTGSNFGGGNVAAGIGPGQSITFTVTGNFSGLTAQQIAESLSLRFQGIQPGDRSTVAEPNPVPEPATMLLLGTGLAGLAGVARRRKAQAKE